MHIRPLTDNCARIHNLGVAAVVGISPFNSYFSESRIAALAAWAGPRYRDVYYYIPDGPSVHTLEALGYAPDRAARKARRQAAWLRNKIVRALARVGVGGDEAESAIVDSARLDGNSAYEAMLVRTRRRFEEDADFQQACLAASGWVLQRRLDETALSERAVLCAAQYLLAELPLFVGASEIVECSSAVFCYHQCPDFIAGIYNGRFGPIVSRNQGFVVVES